MSAKLKPFQLAQFPFDAGGELTISRTGFTGDLGYELWTTPDRALDLWDLLFEAGALYGIRAIGTTALNMARIEAGFIITNMDFVAAEQALRSGRARSPFEMGLDWMIDFDKGHFNGRRALVAEKAKGNSKWALVGLDIEGNVAAEHSLIYHNKKREVGHVTAAIWSPTTKRNIALAMLERPYHGMKNDDLWVEIYALREFEYHKLMVRARVTERPFFNHPRRRATPPASSEGTSAATSPYPPLPSVRRGRRAAPGEGTLQRVSVSHVDPPPHPAAATRRSAFSHEGEDFSHCSIDIVLFMFYGVCMDYDVGTLPSNAIAHGLLAVVAELFADDRAHRGRRGRKTVEAALPEGDAGSAVGGISGQAPHCRPRRATSWSSLDLSVRRRRSVRAPAKARPKAKAEGNAKPKRKRRLLFNLFDRPRRKDWGIPGGGASAADPSRAFMSLISIRESLRSSRPQAPAPAPAPQG